MGEDIPDAAVACFVAAHQAKRAARLERTTPSTEGYPVREHYATDDAGLIAVTIDMSQDPYGGYRIEHRTCSRVETTTRGRLDFAGCVPT